MLITKRFLFFIATGCFLACLTQEEEKLTIAAAANMQFVMHELVQQFENEYGVKSKLIISSSGKLTAQISEGAPFDVFVAANLKYPQKVFDNGKAKDPPEVYAYGKLILWTGKNFQPKLENLTDSNFQHIAIANPKNAPYGEAALQVLDFLKIQNHVQPKLILGESVSQTNQFITTKTVDLGFTALSVVKSPKAEPKGRWLIVPEEMYSPITQAVVILKRKDGKKAEAKLFYDFLFSAKAQKILMDFGYSVNE